MFKNCNGGRNEEGQALLFVIVALTVGLTVGVSIAFRTLSSVSRISTTDTSSRVLAAAEGGIESFLAYHTADLLDLSSDCTSLDASDYEEDSPCVIEFSPISTDNISARAVVSVASFYGDVDDNYIYRTSIDGGESVTLNLTGYSGDLTMCWAGESDVFYGIYDSASSPSDWAQEVLCPEGGCVSGSHLSDVTGEIYADFDCSSFGLGDDYEGHVMAISSSSSEDLETGLTITPLNNRISLVLVPENNQPFPNSLGFLITSKGELIEDSVVKTTRTVRAVKSLPYLPINLLFGVFSNQGIVSTGVQRLP